MVPLWIGAAIGAAARLAGGFLKSRSQKAANKTNIALKEKDVAYQTEFAQNGIRWRVEDARAAGISPLAAMGANTHSYTPSAIGVTPEDGVAEGISRAGGNIDRAIRATQSERARLENDLLRSQIKGQEIENAVKISNNARMGANPNPPGPGSNFIVPGQVQSGLKGDIRVMPRKTVARAHGTNSSVSTGNIPDIAYSAGRHNQMYPVASKEFAEAAEMDTLINIPTLNWMFRNQIMPNFDPRWWNPPSTKGLPKGYRWEYSSANQAYVPVNRKTGYWDNWIKRTKKKWPRASKYIFK
jgi:hypothetical protein